MLKVVRVHEWSMVSTTRSLEGLSHIGFLEF